MTKKSQICVELNAYWGNDDAESIIKVSRSKWLEIQEGAQYVTRGWAWYEGKRFSVGWAFADAHFSIDGNEGA